MSIGTFMTTDLDRSQLTVLLCYTVLLLTTTPLSRAEFPPVPITTITFLVSMARKDEMLAVYFVKINCLLLLLYVAVKHSVSTTLQRSAEAACRNNAFNCCEGVKALRFYCKCLPAYVLMDVGKILFWRKCQQRILHTPVKERSQ